VLLWPIFAVCSIDNISWNCAMSLFSCALRYTSCCWTSFAISMSVALVTAEWAELKNVSVALVVGNPHLVALRCVKFALVLVWQMAVKLGLIVMAEMDFHVGPCCSAGHHSQAFRYCCRTGFFVNLMLRD